jgi:WhiB family redox-sensing transcriptional regulator
VAGLTTRPATGTNWQADGLCRQTDPELFFPGKGEPTAEAKRICLGCEVRTQCLEWALKYGERGIWGATTTAQRRRILRDREDAPAPTVDPVKAARDQAIRRLTNEGYSATEIAERVGCTKRTVVRARSAVAA